MKKNFRHNLCAILIASFCITGASAAYSYEMPSPWTMLWRTITPFGWTLGILGDQLPDTITVFAKSGGVGAVVVYVIGVYGVPAAARLTTTLSELGGPIGTLAGYITGKVIEYAAKFIADKGLDVFFRSLAEEWRNQGKSLDQIEKDIDDIELSIISDSLKAEVKAKVRQNWI